MSFRHPGVYLRQAAAVCLICYPAGALFSSTPALAANGLSVVSDNSFASVSAKSSTNGQGLRSPENSDDATTASQAAARPFEPPVIEGWGAWAVGANPLVSPVVLTKLASDKDTRVREAVARADDEIWIAQPLTQ
jgi:hypothetical protein